MATPSCSSLLLRHLPAWLGIWLCLLVGPSAAAPPGASEAAVKAAYVYNFIKFTEWPQVALAESDRELVICSDADDALQEALQSLASKPAKGRTISVRTLPDAGLDGCHAALIDKPRNADRLGGTEAVLTVSMFDNDAAMIYLFRSGKKLRFSVNLEPSQRASIKLSAKLLAVAADVIE